MTGEDGGAASQHNSQTSLISSASRDGISAAGMGPTPPAPPVNSAPSNFKTVMLCDRPPIYAFETQQAKDSAAHATGPPGTLPFYASAATSESLGLTPPRQNPVLEMSDNKAVALARKQRADRSHLRRHRKWLLAYQTSQKRKQAEQASGNKELSEKEQRFRDYSTKLRQAIRAAARGDAQAAKKVNSVLDRQITEAVAEARERVSQQAGASSSTSTSATPASAAVAPAAAAVGSSSSPHAETKGQARVNDAETGVATEAAASDDAVARKPAWALTQERAVQQDETDVDDLLDFARGLDFEQYLDDFEVRQALAVMKSRVATLRPAIQEETASGFHDAEGDDEAERNWRREFVDRWNATAISEKDKNGDNVDMASSRGTRPEHDRQAEDDDARSCVSRASRGSVGSVRSMLQSHGSLKRVHSDRSLHQVLTDVMARKAARDQGKVAPALIKQGIASAV